MMSVVVSPTRQQDRVRDARRNLLIAAALIPAPPRVPNWGSCSVTYRSSFVSSRRVV
jgi:hypothetical protein